MPLMSLESFKQQYPNALNAVVRVKNFTPADLAKYNVKPQNKLVDPSNNLIPNNIGDKAFRTMFLSNNIQEMKD